MDLSLLTGREHWLELNKQWRAKGCADAEPKTKKPRAARKPLSPHSYNYVYRMLVVERCPLKDPLPLTDTIALLVYGWKKTGVWPADTPADT
ncbi:hypothetical protein GGI00_003124 [Coemansia sp. RSA 2681]|nr:hypothetical protein GGI00_003124 [Coemansia sp. RSA 2681]